MSASYNPNRTSAVDRVRAALGDTDVAPAANALFQNEEIAAVVTSAGSERLAIGQLASELVVRFARKPVSIRAGSVQVDYSERLSRWQALADSILDGTTQDAGGTPRSIAVLNQVIW